MVGGDKNKKKASKSANPYMGATMTPGSKPYVKLVKKEPLPKPLKRMGKVK